MHMWKCPYCFRVFERQGQMHTCSKKPLEEHFANKKLAKEIFEYILKKINTEIGKADIVSIPCCVHLFGKYDFFAALPKRDGLEIRFALNRELTGGRIKQVVPVSQVSYKICIDLKSVKDIDAELLSWISESYHLKD